MAIAQSIAYLPSSKTLTLYRTPCLSPSNPLLSLRHSLRISGVSATFSGARPLRCTVDAFDPTIPLEEALTPPGSWYTQPSFLSLELERVFFRGWQAVGYIEQIRNPHDFFTGRLGNVEYVVCRDTDGDLHCFHNVCQHHASLLAFGSGQKTCLECPYHGWTYGLDGKLLKATRITGIKKFNINEFGLKPIEVATWGPFVLIRLDNDAISCDGRDEERVGDEWLGTASHLLSTNGIDTSLTHVCRRDYTINCNWKVFCDNYLDGGYHVPYAHGGLASGLDLSSYETLTYEKVSVQRCGGTTSAEDGFDRLGSKALYAFVYPNFMINRYGPWMDTNLVIPLCSRKCQVIFDYFLDPAHVEDESFVLRSLEESERVQVEDIELCEGVQRGLESPAYHCGRYAPSVEKAMHHFHCLLHSSLTIP
ncbi:choline monooxygenase, chloroplastic-like isoform X1 [Carex rostrata]